MRDKFNLVRLRRVLLLLIIDVVIINAAAFSSLFVRFELDLSLMEESGFFESVLSYMPLNTLATILIFALLKLYDSLWDYAEVDETLRIVAASAMSAVQQVLGMKILSLAVPRSFPVLYGLLLGLMAASVRFAYRLGRLILHRLHDTRLRRRTMLIGAGSAGAMVLREFRSSSYSKNEVVCIIDDDPGKCGAMLSGVPVVGGRDRILSAAKKYGVEEIVFAIPSMPRPQRQQVLEICQKTGCRLKTLPALSQLANGEVGIKQIRDVEIADLLGREQVKVDIDKICAYVAGKTVLVTGGGGSIGSELCRQIAKSRAKRLVIFDIYENNAYDIQQELRRRHPELDLAVLIGSVRDRGRIYEVMEKYRPELVFHAAAHKHVPLMEASPAEAIKNNVFGTLNTAQAASDCGAQRFILISTDKAVNPTSVMGASKRICEMVIQLVQLKSRTEFVAVRFGNVLGSNGSVIPLFKKQILEGGPVTVTDKNVIRYFMTIPEAVSLVLQAGAYARGGEIFILDMGEPVRIDDLARKMIKLSGFEPDVDIQVVYTGLRPGEKLYEELLMDCEGKRKTGNNLIYIGREEPIDPDSFGHQLLELHEADENDPQRIRGLISKIVPTYHAEIISGTEKASSPALK